MATDPLVFLLSPADCSGKRAGHLLRKDARSLVAQRLRSSEGATIGEVFSFVSGLYFRGKLAYASAFACPPAGVSGAQVIVPGWGLRAPDAIIDLRRLRSIARVRVDPANRRYTRPLVNDAARLVDGLPASTRFVLLGSIATEKYMGPLAEVLGRRLLIPDEFIGLGVMSRGSLLLRRTERRRELTYVRVSGSTSARTRRTA